MAGEDDVAGLFNEWGRAKWQATFGPSFRKSHITGGSALKNRPQSKSGLRCNDRNHTLQKGSVRESALTGSGCNFDIEITYHTVKAPLYVLP